MELLERETQRKLLEEALGLTSAGKGHIVLISGEAGIGKTVLVQDFVQGHRHAHRVFWGACDPLNPSSL